MVSLKATDPFGALFRGLATCIRFYPLRTHYPLPDDLLSVKFVLKDGLSVWRRPGLGIRIKESMLAEHGAQH